MTELQLAEFVADNVRRIMDEQTPKWDQTTLSEKTGIKPPHISRLLAAKHGPGAKTLTTVANALGVTVAELCEETKPKKKK